MLEMMQRAKSFGYFMNRNTINSRIMLISLKIVRYKNNIV